MAIAEYVSTFIENIKKLWNEFDLKAWAETVGGTSADAVEAAVYFGLSFGIGFFFKKYFKFVFLCLIIAAFLIKALEYGNFLIIDWQMIKTSLGITPTTDINTMINQGFDWIKNHLLLFVTTVVGFLVGYKLG